MDVHHERVTLSLGISGSGILTGLLRLGDGALGRLRLRLLLLRPLSSSSSLMDMYSPVTWTSLSGVVVTAAGVVAGAVSSFW